MTLCLTTGFCAVLSASMRVWCDHLFVLALIRFSFSFISYLSKTLCSSLPLHAHRFPTHLTSRLNKLSRTLAITRINMSELSVANAASLLSRTKSNLMSSMPFHSKARALKHNCTRVFACSNSNWTICLIQLKLICPMMVSGPVSRTSTRWRTDHNHQIKILFGSRLSHLFSACAKNQIFWCLPLVLWLCSVSQTLFRPFFSLFYPFRFSFWCGKTYKRRLIVVCHSYWIKMVFIES